MMAFGYMKLPTKLFGVGRYTVTMELPRTGGLYATGNVTYRGTEVGRIESVDLTDSGRVEAVLSLQSDVRIPSNVKAEVHSQSAIGEQYVELLPQDDTSAPLQNGSVIPLAKTSIPPDINTLLNATNVGLQAIPRDNLKTAIDESYAAVGGLGPEIARLVDGSTTLATDARKNIGPITSLIDQWKPVVDTQTETADSIQAWAAHLANITNQLEVQDKSVAGLIRDGAPAAAEARQLFDRLKPTLPVLLANLVSTGQVAVTYQPAIEQLLVLLPAGVSNLQGIIVANMNTKQAYKGTFLSFNTNINLPPPCTTGFLPTQQRRVPTFEDYPDRPSGDLYCRIPQDSSLNVRGARNLPCLTVPGKRAPTVQMCESRENYVPLNDGFNWKGDPNATLSGQDIPQHPPAGPQATPTPPADSTRPGNGADDGPPLAIAQYDPATGSYVGPDGRVYTQGNLADGGHGARSLQDMMLPPNG